MRDTLRIPLRPWPILVAVALLGGLPFVALAVGQPFYVVFATRVLIYALIATSLNLLIGYVGLVSFGHAAFVGAGAYTVAVLMMAGVTRAWLLWPAAIVVAALLALLIGAISLRTRGVYFIMITLAFAQMIYYLVVSLRVLGSDDGLTLSVRPSLDVVALDRDTHFYLVALTILLAALLGMRALLNAPLGRALQGIRDNETRMEAIGFPTYRLKLLAFVIAGAAAGLGGGLLASLNGLVGPNLLHWPESGLLMIMVILGGAGRLPGGVLGAAALLIAQEALAGHTIHWPLAIGVVLLVVVLFAPQGLSGLMRRAGAKP
ncbi:branched-chain amino acid ABC transporter permease [Reyranella sp.]|uniref:branched-chain amino acid ABC transporter permease n=1 Tax=Reyranella sp. TaxID=1929291 RepID=UPI003784A67D